MSLESAGARYGFGARSYTSDFKQSEVFVNWNLPWSYDLFTRWHLSWKLDCAAGWLGGAGDDAAIFSSGPTLMLRRNHIPLALEFGTTPTLMTRENFGGKDLGSLVQFTSYGTLDWELGHHFRIGYRYQHMSNAHLGGSNPGLNMHTFQAAWRF